MNAVRLAPIEKPLDATISVPGSKSLTNRALVIAALADGTSKISNALFADDTRRMIDALRRLGFNISADTEKKRIDITGRSGHIPNLDAVLDCGNSGTTIRFCTALTAAGHGTYTLDGIARMRERPIGPLVDALRTLGTGVEYQIKDGFPPLTVHAQGLTGRNVVTDSRSSSQFLSALLMVAPTANRDVLIESHHRPVSTPYLSMTTQLMETFGVSVISDIRDDGARCIVPAPQTYQPITYTVEPDASNASYFLAAPAIAGGRATIHGLGTQSTQGDARFVDVLEQMGCRVDRSPTSLTVASPPPDQPLRGIDVDLNELPDMAQTLAVLALFATSPTTIRNVANLRIKETDRLAALTRELTTLGARVTQRDDGITIEPPETVSPGSIRTYDDHRMAMSFALASLTVPGLLIENPDCVNKTFPGFFDHWDRFCRS